MSTKQFFQNEVSRFSRDSRTPSAKHGGWGVSLPTATIPSSAQRPSFARGAVFSALPTYCPKHPPMSPSGSPLGE